MAGKRRLGVTRVRAELFGSLGATGHGHGTPRAVLLGLEGESPRTVDVGAVGATMDRIAETRRLSLLGQILDDRLRLKIRQELGETYSPAAYHVPSDTYKDFGYMTCMATLKPEDVAKEIVARYHGPEAAKAAEEQFELVHKRREVPEEIEERARAEERREARRAAEEDAHGISP